MVSFPPRRWVFGIDAISRSEKQALVISIPEPVGQLEPRDEQKSRVELSAQNKREFLEKKAWEAAIAPGKQFLMTAFMLWMMGSGIHIMNIIFTFYQIMGPLKGVFAVNQVFKGFSENAKELGMDLTLQKLVYIACQLGVLLFILHRFGSMGLLPTSASDWLAMVPVKSASEFAAGALI